MNSIAEHMRRAAIVVLWVRIAIGVLVGDVCAGVLPPARQLTPRGLEWRAIRPIGGRLVAVRVQLLIA